MPEMHDIACHFDTDPFYDAYTAAFAFFGQATTFNEASRDGSVVKRRVLSVKPGANIPARRVISVYGEIWLVGDSNTDGFDSTPIRQVHWLKKSNAGVFIRTPGQLLSGAVVAQAYANMDYLKDTVNGVTDAEYDVFWEVYVTPTENSDKGMYITWGSRLLRVRSAHLDLSGLVAIQADEVDVPNVVTVVTDVGGTYNPVTETTTGGGPTNYPAILIDAYKLYRYQTEADPKVLSGDMYLVVQTSTPSEVGRVFTFNGSKWQVIAKTPELDAYCLHIRKK